jgi:hypothetical protein
MSLEEGTQDGQVVDQTLESPVVDATDGSQGGDPLDLLSDPEEIRAEAKKFRSIAQRKAKPIVEKKIETQQIVQTSDFVRRSDLERGATNKAKQLVGSEIAAEYDELIKIPLGGYDPLDAESIALNLKERYAILKARKPSEEKKNEGVNELSSTNVVTGTGAGGNVVQKPDKKNPPNFSLPKDPKDWYVKP